MLAPGTKVKLKTFNDTSIAPSDCDPSENYWSLIGKSGTIVKPENDRLRVLVKFDVSLESMGLTCHNEVENSLLILSSDLETFLTRRERMRRVGLLCVHFARNLAFYREGIENGKLIRSDPFWKTVNFNFFDQSILEWCKLFADKKGKHYWEKVVRDKSDFELNLLKVLSTNRKDFDTYADEMRMSRDKFIAHLDSEREDYRPYMDKAIESVFFYYDYIHLYENEDNNYPDFPKDLRGFYAECQKLAKSVYKT